MVLFSAYCASKRERKPVPSKFWTTGVQLINCLQPAPTHPACCLLRQPRDPLRLLPHLYRHLCHPPSLSLTFSILSSCPVRRVRECLVSCAAQLAAGAARALSGGHQAAAATVGERHASSSLGNLLQPEMLVEEHQRVSINNNGNQAKTLRLQSFRQTCVSDSLIKPRLQYEQVQYSKKR